MIDWNKIIKEMTEASFKPMVTKIYVYDNNKTFILSDNGNWVEADGEA